MTEKLYYQDPYLARFEARLVRRLEIDGQPAVVLDRTAFYPTGGGQPNDLGTLNGIPVVDVQADDDKAVVHILQSPLAQERASGELDWARRFDHMQQHSGQHILSQAFEQTLDAQTVSFHLGQDVCTIDLNRAPLEMDQITPGLEQANQIVFEDRSVMARFVDHAELARMPLRKKPAVDGPIRIVQVENYDWSPCGGTHVARSGEVGPIQIVRLERRNKQTRIYFLCGWRALADYRRKHGIVQALSSYFTTAEDEIIPTVERMEVEIKALRKQISAVQTQMVDYQIAGWLANAEQVGPWRVILLILEDYDLNLVKEIAHRLTGHAGAIALLATRANLVFARAEGVDADMGATIRAACAASGGKGGGRPQFAQGNLVDSDLVQPALAAARRALLDLD
ncbi:MAG: alanyl-tRNA editing protein [Anaerolineae bacterium]|nr:alanyl-tRNA editing protein [Anaerolineae bacterium]